MFRVGSVTPGPLLATNLSLFALKPSVGKTKNPLVRSQFYAQQTELSFLVHAWCTIESMLACIGVARIFDWGGAQITNHMQWRHQKFSKEKLFVSTKILQNGRSKAVVYRHLTRILLKWEGVNKVKKHKCLNWETCWACNSNVSQPLGDFCTVLEKKLF